MSPSQRCQIREQGGGRKRHGWKHVPADYSNHPRSFLQGKLEGLQNNRNEREPKWKKDISG